MNDIVKDYLTRGATLMGEGNFEQAKEMFLKANEEEETLQGCIDLGNACASLGEYDNAIEAFSKALILEPDNGEVLFDLGNVYLLQENIKKSIEYYNKAEQAGFSNPRLFVNQAALYNAIGDEQMELRCYTKAINSNPLLGDIYLKKAMLFINMKRYAEALETLDEMRKLFPDSFETYDLAAKIYTSLGNYNEAIRVIEEGISRFPEDINMKISKMEVFMAYDKVTEAEELLTQIKASKYAHLFKRPILLQEVSIAGTKNEPEKMKELLREVISLENGICDESSRYMLMVTCNILEDYATALEMAEVLEKQDSKTVFSISGLYYKGEFLKKLGKEKEALAHFRQVTKKLRVFSTTNRSFYEVYLYRVLAHKNIGEYENAIELAEYITNLQPERPDGYVVLADIYKAMGNEAKSEEIFKVAQEKDPGLTRR